MPERAPDTRFMAALHASCLPFVLSATMRLAPNAVSGARAMGYFQVETAL
jgi:hypothetical protein